MTEVRTGAAARPQPSFAEFIAMMATLMALTALSIDVMLPALPHIRDDFDLTDPNRMQLVVTTYVLGFAFGQLLTGPLSDWLGRRPVLLGGLAIYAVAAFACVIAGSFEALLAARVLQGIANAAPRIVAVAVVRDLYGGRRMAEVMSFVMMVFIIVPVIAPTVGSGIMLVGSWHVIFVALCVVAVGAFVWMAMRLPETRPADGEKVSAAWLVAAFREVATNRVTLGYTLATGVVFGALMGYINSAQQIFVDVYDLGGWFPVVFGAAAAALSLSSFLNSRLVMRIGMRRISHAAHVGFIVAALGQMALAWSLGQPPLWAFVLLLSLNLFCFGLMMPNFNAIAMEPMGRIAGTASSFVGAVTTALGAMLGLVVGQSFDGTVLPLVAGFAVFGLVGLGIVLVTEHGQLFHPHNPTPRG